MLLEVYKKATTWCGLRWPAEVTAEAVEVPLWQGIEEYIRPPRKSKLLLAKGFKELQLLESPLSDCRTQTSLLPGL